LLFSEFQHDHPFMQGKKEGFSNSRRKDQLYLCIQ